MDSGLNSALNSSAGRDSGVSNVDMVLLSRMLPELLVVVSFLRGVDLARPILVDARQFDSQKLIVKQPVM